MWSQRGSNWEPLAPPIKLTVSSLLYNPYMTVPKPQLTPPLLLHFYSLTSLLTMTNLFLCNSCCFVRWFKSINLMDYHNSSKRTLPSTNDSSTARWRLLDRLCRAADRFKKESSSCRPSWKAYFWDWEWAIDSGRDSFNQNFRKFRSKTQWIGSVQPEKLPKNGSTF